MIVIACPNCGTRYRLSAAVVAKGSRLRCAECEYRWVPEAPPVSSPPQLSPPPSSTPPSSPPPPEHDEEAAFAAVQQQMQARWDPAWPGAAAGEARDAEPSPAPEADPFEPADDPVEEVPPSRLVATIVAVIAGAALSIAAAGLWLNDVDLSGVPVAGPMFAGFAPPPPLVVTVSGATTKLPGGGRVLEMHGTIANPGKTAVRVPALAAALAGPAGTLRWTIPPPVAVLKPGSQVEFSSTATGFPPDARTLSVRPVR